MNVSSVRSSGAVRLLEDLVRISSAGANEGTVNRHCALMLNAVNARTQFVNPLMPIVEPGEFYIPSPIEVRVGGATVFVLGIERYERIGS